jgi:hypothetical protein
MRNKSPAGGVVLFIIVFVTKNLIILFPSSKSPRFGSAAKVGGDFYLKNLPPGSTSSVILNV